MSKHYAIKIIVVFRNNMSHKYNYINIFYGGNVYGGNKTLC